MTKFEQSCSVEYSQGKKSKFKITISNNPDLIQFKIEDLTSFSSDEYEFESDLESLQKLNRFFLLFLNLDEVSISMIKLIKRKEASVKVEGDLCKLKIMNALNDNEFEISLKKIEKEEKGNEEGKEKVNVEIKESTPIIRELKSRIDELEEKNAEYEKKIEKFEKIVESINKKFESGVEPQEDMIDYGRKMFESNIIDIKEEKAIYNWIKTKIISTELLFDTAKDGDSVEAFKKKVDGICPTLTIIKTETGIVFGGYLTAAWKERFSMADNNAFCFSLNPSKKYSVTDSKYAVSGYNEKENKLFQFGCTYFRIEAGCTKNSNSCVIGRGYEKGLTNVIPTNQKFKVSRIEVFKLNF